ncbi:interferon-induced protein with tetratricopeptide repeats 1-like [Lycodopsis pacificus]
MMYSNTAVQSDLCAAQSQTTLLSKLEALQCHFTWALDPSKTDFLRLRDTLVDIGTEEGTRWLGHIYNLRGFIQYKLGLTEDAQSFFNKAAEAFRQMRKADDGPWLAVNYGNLAWLHHHLGDQAESEAYLSKVEALMKKYPSPSQDELHAEIYAEKAWTLMKFSADIELVSDYFQKAIRMQPDMVEWNTSHIMALSGFYEDCDTGMEADILEKMRVAKEQDPENLLLAVYYLERRAKNGERVEDEARELAEKVLRNPVSSYNGMKAMLRVYRNYVSEDEAVDLAEKALEQHPDVRYLKRCAALTLKWKIVHSSRRRKSIDRAISLHEDVISLYPDCSFATKIDLASIYAKSNHTKADQMYQELLKSDLGPADKQQLYNKYAKYLNNKSLKYHMKAAAIPHQSYFRGNSIEVLRKVKNTRWNPMGKEIQEFLENLQEP